MLNAVFKKKPFWNFICLFCGLLLLGLFIFAGYVDSEATNSDTVSGISLAICICIPNILGLLFNFKAYLYINDRHIKGRYHYFGKIDCDISEVDFVTARINTLIIHLKNGKSHTIMGIENSLVLSSAIKKDMTFEAKEQPETLIKKLNKLKSDKKKWLIYVFIGLALMFINIFITAFLTGERELYEFSKTDWIIMSIMGGVEIATVIATFYFANKTGTNNIPIEKMNYDIKRTIVETKPLLSGNVLNVYSDEDYSGRVTLFGYPNEDDVYYTVELFSSDYHLAKYRTSEIYESIGYLPEDFEDLNDITEKFSN